MEGQDNRTETPSQLNLDHFDPEGVRDLSLALKRASAQSRLRHVRSDWTLTPEEPFSLEAALRGVLDRYGNRLPQTSYC